MVFGLSAAVKQSRSWNELIVTLQSQGISTHQKLKGGTTKVQGLSFSKGEINLKVSQIDRSLSFGNISKKLELNRQQGIQAASSLAFTHGALADRDTLTSDKRSTQETGLNLVKWANKASASIFNPEPANDMDEDPGLANMRKRRKNKSRHL